MGKKLFDCSWTQFTLARKLLSISLNKQEKKLKFFFVFSKLQFVYYTRLTMKCIYVGFACSNGTKVISTLTVFP